MITPTLFYLIILKAPLRLTMKFGRLRLIFMVGSGKIAFTINISNLSGSLVRMRTRNLEDAIIIVSDITIVSQKLI